MDLSGVVTRDDMFAMKQRMVQRGQHVDAMRSAAEAPPAPSTAPPAVGGSSVQSSERCRSLKDRIHDRMVRHAAPGPPLIYEANKDMYAHEVPFPVKTVYEVQQIANPASVPIETRSGHIPPTLLLAAESAALVQSLEDRLGGALQRIAVLENELELAATRVETVQTNLLVSDKEILSLKARNEELVKQAEIVRKECQKQMDDLKIAHAEALQKAEAQQRADAANAVKKVEGVSKTQDAQIKDLQVEKKHLEDIVAELRTQLMQNAQSLQVSTQTVKQLTAELLMAKQQSTFVSSGYKKLETDLRGANAQIVAKDTELTVTRKCVTDVQKLSEQVEKLTRELKDAKTALEKLTGADAENKTLKEKVKALEKDTADKDLRLGELQSHVDSVRRQANQAYLHAKGLAPVPDFSSNQPLMYGDAAAALPTLNASSCPVHGGGLGTVNYPPATASGSLEALRREVELEGQRFKEEQRRWRGVLESPTRRPAL